MLGILSNILFGAAIVVGGSMLVVVTQPVGNANVFGGAFIVAGALVTFGLLTALCGLICDDGKVAAFLGLLVNGLGSLAWCGLAWLAYVVSRAESHGFH